MLMYMWLCEPVHGVTGFRLGDIQIIGPGTYSRRDRDVKVILWLRRRRDVVGVVIGGRGARGRSGIHLGLVRGAAGIFITSAAYCQTCQSENYHKFFHTFLLFETCSLTRSRSLGPRGPVLRNGVPTLAVGFPSSSLSLSRQANLSPIPNRLKSPTSWRRGGRHCAFRDSHKFVACWRLQNFFKCSGSRRRSRSYKHVAPMALEQRFCVEILIDNNSQCR
jgi:hypothetical protein